MSQTTGPLRKMVVEYGDVVTYQARLGDHLVPLNPFVGKSLFLRFTGDIFCVATDKKITKSYGQGYSWEAFSSLPECDSCIVRPETCHFHKGTCRDPKWGEKHCFQRHFLYLSLTSGLKVGITRQTQIPTRWIDQGAIQAMIIGEVADRLTAGKAEVLLKDSLYDKTHWRKMLTTDPDPIDMLGKAHQIWDQYGHSLRELGVAEVEDEVWEFTYPFCERPEKVTSLNFDKTPEVGGKLLGIKGQYLLFDSGVINLRKFQGYEVQLSGN